MRAERVRVVRVWVLRRRVEQALLRVRFRARVRGVVVAAVVELLGVASNHDGNVCSGGSVYGSFWWLAAQEQHPSCQVLRRQRMLRARCHVRDRTTDIDRCAAAA